MSVADRAEAASAGSSAPAEPTTEGPGSVEPHHAATRRSVRHLTWSFLERIVPRASASIVTLVLAHFVVPGVIGVYAWAMVGLTLVQSVTDGAVRQIAVVALRSDDGRSFLRAYARRSAFIGPLVLAVLLGCLVIVLPGRLRADALLLLPLVAVPTVQAARVWAVAQLQTAGGWAGLARAQLLAAVGSFAVSLPILLLTHSLLACAVQGLASELLFTLLSRSYARPLPDVVTQPAPPGSIVAEFWHLVVYALFVWLQLQSDRILLAWFTTTSRLGLYSLSWSMSRAVGDSVSYSTGNVLRTHLASKVGAPAAEVRAAANQVLVPAVMFSSIVIVATGVVSQVVFPLILGPEWSAAIRVVPIMALSALPTLLAWSLTSVLLATGRLRWAAPIRSVGIALALPVAWAARQDLALAAWFLVARELVGLLLTIIATGRYTPVRAVVAGSVALLALSLVAWATY